jgi:HEXXH motif-containing protein
MASAIPSLPDRALPYSGFSCPEAGEDADLLREICVTHSRELTRCHLERNRIAILAASQGLLPFVKQGLRRIDSLENAWEVCFGSIHRSLKEKTDPVWPAAAVGIHLLTRNVAGAWSVSLRRTAVLRWQTLLLPAARHLSVTSDGTRAAVRGRTGGRSWTIGLRRTGEAWRADRPLPAAQLPTIRFADGPPAAICARRPHLLEIAFAEGDFLELEGVDRFVKSCRSAVELVRRAAPEYLSWIGSVLRQIVPCVAGEDVMSSGSSSLLPGLIRVSADKSPEATAEMMLHEATHQYYYIASQLGDAVDGTDRTLYYSPVKGTNRPIDKIVIAYHAFANVERFYRRCLSNTSSGREYFSNNLEELAPQLDLLEQHLRRTRSLTAIGEGLLYPLMERRRPS